MSMEKSLRGLLCPERMRTAERGTLNRIAKTSRTRVFARFLCAGSRTEILSPPFFFAPPEPLAEAGPSSIFSFFAPALTITFKYIPITNKNILIFCRISECFYKFKKKFSIRRQCVRHVLPFVFLVQKTCVDKRTGML